jgi:hypothetical protein
MTILGILTRNKNKVVEDLHKLASEIHELSKLAASLHVHAIEVDEFRRTDFGQFESALRLNDAPRNAVLVEIENVENQKKKIKKKIQLWLEISFDTPTQNNLASKLFPGASIAWVGSDLSSDLYDEIKDLTHLLDEMEDINSRIDYFSEKIPLEAGEKRKNSIILPDNNSSSRSESIFVAYSHKDKKWLDRIEIHLTPLQKKGQLTIWNDTQLIPGSHWEEEIHYQLKKASVAVLLVSADFLASKFISEVELPNILSSERERGLDVIPVFVSPADVPEEILQFQGINGPDTTFDEIPSANVDRLLVKLVKRFK